MQGILDFFNSENFMPHGHCFLWQPEILWLYIISDAAIIAAYYSIPLVLIYLVWKRKDIPFGVVFWLFGAFIFLCGTTHLIDIWVIWHPDYAIQAVLKGLTGIVSLATFFVIIKLIPQALALASPTQLAKLNEELQQNITQRDTAQKELQKSYDIVEKKVEERTEELKQSLIELEKSNRELDDFAYIVSHDLKEPLRGLHNHASFMLEDYKDKMGEEEVKRLERMTYLSKRMETLVNDLLYFSRLGRVDLAIQQTDLNNVVSDIEKMMDGYLKEHNAKIIIPNPLPKLVCDKPRVTEALRNLITNAVKYNDKKEPVVEIGFKENNIIYVKDNGIGIAPEYHKDIFHIFKRLSPNNNDGGTGAGLTFVKKIIERHDGRIWLESTPGKGTTFYFTLSSNN